jgi:iron-sulfur cluster repair protein YtfE (RIC family)
MIEGEPFTAPVPGRANRRSEELAPLSREHHHALAQALELKRAEPATADAAWKSFLAFWETEGNEHFAEEEDVLLPAYARVADPAHPAIVRMLLEHVLIRARVGEIRDQDAPSPPDLNRLGTWLELHVRLEERIVFPLIEEALPEADLRRITDGLTAGDP